MALWLLAVAALLLATAALAYARHTARKLAMLEEQYWQLKFDYGELKARVVPSPPPVPEARQTFVPLTQLKR